eukprot:3523122-Lingulodinium_polyedra.AAC.1
MPQHETDPNRATPLGNPCVGWPKPCQMGVSGAPPNRGRHKGLLNRPLNGPRYQRNEGNLT